MKDTQTIHRVQCNTCKATHAYKDPSMAKAKVRSKTRGRKVETKPIAEIWLEAVSNANGKSKAYGIKGSFIVGDIIDHTKFGPGVVQTIVDNDKIEVIFRHEIKTLIHNK